MGLCVTQVNTALPQKAQVAAQASAASFLAVLVGQAQASPEPEAELQDSQAAAAPLPSQAKVPGESAAPLSAQLPASPQFLDSDLPTAPDVTAGELADTPARSADGNDLDEVDYSLTVAALGTSYFISPVVDLAAYALSEVEAPEAGGETVLAAGAPLPESVTPAIAQTPGETVGTPEEFRLTPPPAPPFGSKVETFVTLAQGELSLDAPQVRPEPVDRAKVETRGIWRLWGRADVAGVARAKDAQLTPTALTGTASNGEERGESQNPDQDQDALFLEGEKLPPAPTKAPAAEPAKAASQPLATEKSAPSPSPAPELSAASAAPLNGRKAAAPEEAKVSAADRAAPPVGEAAPNHSRVDGAQRAEAPERPAADPEAMRAKSDVYRQVVEGARVVFARGGERAVIRLSPESLGNVHVELTRTQEGLTAHFRVESREAHEALTEQMPQLKESFEARGVHLSDAQVLLGDGSDTNARNHAAPRREQRARATAFGMEGLGETIEDTDTVWSPWGFEARA